MEIVCVFFLGKYEKIMDFEWEKNNQWYVLPSMTMATGEITQKTMEVSTRESMGRSSNSCWWIFQQAMELIGWTAP